ncbi:SPFH domain-containing protein [Altererythrobacter aestuarii]|uniref:SPFH domain-containing protein n=2 Tax=Alteraurantiacibacter aestuarii TaxID=650004 RepID=A0A844ZS07_9SPHN|nr:SPFH domain-containing protein [Alteraurantiacibacter aestuarii]
MIRSREGPASTYSGYPMLLVLLAIVALALFVLSTGIPPKGSSKLIKIMFVLTTFGSGFAVLFFSVGFYMIQPNQGAVITLFGEYRGTDRKEGLRWRWPWMGRNKLSVRAHNIHSEKVKINDLRGNPIEIACNVVWRVADTAQAAFDVDDYKEFVNIQIEAGLRTVGSRYPYDDIEEAETTLRSDADVVNSELQTELNERLSAAGIVVDEAGLTHLAYAPEIAGAMLRRQQADAVISARAKLVLGAVSMVEMALEKLSADDIVHLDDERRAAMVSNLMVVLCGDREVNPVVNAGSLYQ